MSNGPVFVRNDGRLSVVPPEDDYTVQTISLATARAAPGTALGLSGTSLTVAQLTGAAQIRLNSTAKPAISLRGGETYTGDFAEVYLTNSAQPMGVIVLWIGRRTS